MLAPEKSPVHQLVAPWWVEGFSTRFTARHATERRLALAIATLEEQRLKIAAGIPWNPFADARCLWAADSINRLENPYHRTNADLTARAAWHFESPLAPCGKDRAAGPP